MPNWRDWFGGDSSDSSTPSSQAPSPESSPGYDTDKQVLNWEDWWNDANIPVIGYDPIQDVIVLLKGADHSVYNDKDILVYDFRTGSWTEGDTKFSGTDDISNMVVDPLTSELQALYINNATPTLKKFKLYQSATTSSSTVNIETPFYDFGSTGLKKRLYKVKVLCHGTNLDDLAVQAAYDGGSYGNIFGGSPQAFANTSAGIWTVQTFTVAAPTDFVNLSIKIYATGAMTTADWGISEISFIYRELGYR